MTSTPMRLLTFVGLLMAAAGQPVWACEKNDSQTDKDKKSEIKTRRDIDPNATGGARGAALTGTLVVRVISDNAPVNEVQVCLTRGEQVLAEETTNERGIARVSALPEGRYEVTVSKKGLETRTETVVITAGEMEVELIMEKATHWFWRFWRRSDSEAGGQTLHRVRAPTR